MTLEEFNEMLDEVLKEEREQPFTPIMGSDLTDDERELCNTYITSTENPM